jgi:hypothetical protein
MQDFNELGDAGVCALVNARISVEASKIWIDLLYSRHFCNELQRVSFEKGESSHFVVRHCPNGDVLREPIDSSEMDSIIRQAEHDWALLVIRNGVGESAFANVCSVEDSKEEPLENELLDSIIRQTEHDVGESPFANACSVEVSEETSFENQLQLRYQQLELTFHRVRRDFYKIVSKWNSWCNDDDFQRVLKEIERCSASMTHNNMYMTSLLLNLELPHSMDDAIGDDMRTMLLISERSQEYIYKLRQKICNHIISKHFGPGWLEDYMRSLFSDLQETCKELPPEETFFGANSDIFGHLLVLIQPFPCRVAFLFRRLHLVRYFHCGGHRQFIVLSSCIIAMLVSPQLIQRSNNIGDAGAAAIGNALFGGSLDLLEFLDLVSGIADA